MPCGSAVRFTASRAALMALPGPVAPSEKESSAGALGPHRSLCGTGPTACLRAIPSDRSWELPPVECVLTIRRFLGVETLLDRACPAPTCTAIDVCTRHDRNYTRFGGQTLHHHQLRNVLARTLHDMEITVTIEDRSRLDGGHGDLSMTSASLPVPSRTRSRPTCDTRRFLSTLQSSTSTRPPICATGTPQEARTATAAPPPSGKAENITPRDRTVKHSTRGAIHLGRLRFRCLDASELRERPSSRKLPPIHAGVRGAQEVEPLKTSS